METFISLNVANGWYLKSVCDTEVSENAVGFLRILAKVGLRYILFQGATIKPRLLWLVSTTRLQPSASSSPLVHPPLRSGGRATCRVDWLQKSNVRYSVFVGSIALLYCAEEQKKMEFSFDRSQQLVKKKKKKKKNAFNFHVDSAICLEKASGWVLITLAIELGCQLASSDNCFPWQDPVGGEKRRAMLGINTGIHFCHSSVIIVPHACRYLLPVGMRAKLWLTPIDWRGQGVRGEGGGRPWVTPWLSSETGWCEIWENLWGQTDKRGKTRVILMCLLLFIYPVMVIFHINHLSC